MITLEKSRLEALTEAVERMAGGDASVRAPISEQGDELDAFAHAVNVLSSELLFRMSELKQAQTRLSASGKLAALGEISAGLAHELNNPLTVVQGYVEQLRSSLPTGPAAQSLEKIDRHVERMRRLVRNIMELARQSPGLREAVRVPETLQKAAEILAEKLRLSNVALALDCDEGCPAVLGDALKLEQVWINVIGNARDAIEEAHDTRGGSVRIEVRCPEPGWVAVKIIDNGKGMDEETAERVFEPFFTTKGVGRGTGLGLSISHGIIQEHGGTISCRSALGRGTELLIRLPVAASGGNRR